MESGFQRLAPRARTHGIRPHAVSHRFRSGCEARSADRGAGSIVVENGIVFDPVSRRLRSGLPGGGPTPQKAPDGSPGTPGRTRSRLPHPSVRRNGKRDPPPPGVPSLALRAFWGCPVACAPGFLGAAPPPKKPRTEVRGLRVARSPTPQIQTSGKALFSGSAARRIVPVLSQFVIVAIVWRRLHFSRL